MPLEFSINAPFLGFWMYWWKGKIFVFLHSFHSKLVDSLSLYYCYGMVRECGNSFIRRFANFTVWLLIWMEMRLHSFLFSYSLKNTGFHPFYNGLFDRNSLIIHSQSIFMSMSKSAYISTMMSSNKPYHKSSSKYPSILSRLQSSSSRSSSQKTGPSRRRDDDDDDDGGDGDDILEAFGKESKGIKSPSSRSSPRLSSVHHQSGINTRSIRLNEEDGGYRKDKSTDSDEKNGNEKKIEKRESSPWNQVLKNLESSEQTKNSLGKIVKITEKNSMEEIDELQCKHFNTCGGCTIKGNFTNIPVIKKAQMFFTSENIKEFPIHTYNYWEWRTHVKLAVQPLSKWGGLKFGLYKTGTHEVEPIPECRVHHPRINEAVEILKAEASALGIKGYQHGTDKLPASGELRYVQLSVERSTGKIQLVLVWNSPTFKETEQNLPRLVKKLKSRYDIFHSITANFQTSKGNTIFNFNPKSWKLLWGAPILKEQIGEAIFMFRPQIFRQANLDAFEKGIIPAVIKHIPKNSIVAELYSGIGIIGLNAASKSQNVFCSDSNEFVDDVFDECVESLPEQHREKVFYENLPADEAVEAGQCDDADIVIVDPPRRGLDTGVLNLLLEKHPTRSAAGLKRLIYVSCGYEALEKDTRSLLESGLWKLRSMEGFILFPGSDHLESVVVFDRIGRKWELSS